MIRNSVFIDESMSKPERNSIIRTLQTASIRLDGREPHEMRTVAIKYGHTYGTVTISFGSAKTFGSVDCTTVCTACVEAKLVEPNEDNPGEGFLRFNVKHHSYSNPEKNIRKKHDVFLKTLNHSQMIDKIIRVSRAIDTESLCVIQGKWVWELTINVHVMNDAGNVFDCAYMAAICSLVHFRRPEVHIDGPKVTLLPTNQREPIPLSIHHVPVCISFQFLDEDADSVCDASLKEEYISQGTLILAMNAQKELCLVEKNGGIALSIEKILECSEIALNHVKAITHLIGNSLKSDGAKREKNARPIYFAFNDPFQSIKEETDSDVDDISSADEQAPAIPPQQVFKLREVLHEDFGSSSEDDILVDEDEIIQSLDKQAFEATETTSTSNNQLDKSKERKKLHYVTPKNNSGKMDLSKALIK